MIKVLITGATGYIGSHLCKLLYDKGNFIIHGLDINNDQNDISAYCERVIIADIRHYEIDEEYDAIIHLAGLIQVAESTQTPSKYYDNNINGTLNILMQYTGHVLFASTAGAFSPISPYAKSKVAAEDIIKELSSNYTIFRFFNVAGSDGVNRQVGNSTHLIRIAAETASGKRDNMSIYGTDYDTYDGTCIRDYVHVLDLCDAILNAIILGPQNTDFECIGTGDVYSTFEVVNTMKKVTNRDFTVNIKNRRQGDPAILTVESKSKLMNNTTRTLEEMCYSAYNIEL